MQERGRDKLGKMKDAFRDRALVFRRRARSLLENQVSKPRHALGLQEAWRSGLSIFRSIIPREPLYMAKVNVHVQVAAAYANIANNASVTAPNSSRTRRFASNVSVRCMGAAGPSQLGMVLHAPSHPRRRASSNAVGSGRC